MRSSEGFRRALGRERLQENHTQKFRVFNKYRCNAQLDSVKLCYSNHGLQIDAGPSIR